MRVLISGDHEVVKIGLLDLWPLKFTHSKQRGAEFEKGLLQPF